MTNTLYLLLGFVAGLMPCLLVWALSRRNREVPAALAELQRSLTESFSRANADMAGRVEQIKGDLRSDLADRLQTGLNGVRETVDRQLAEGRNEQSKRLAESSAGMEQKFDAFRTATESKLALIAEKQAETARQSRTELANTLAQTTSGLLQRFESLEARTAQNLDAIRNKVDERLQSISEQVQQKLEKNIQEGFAHFQKVQEHLKAAEEQLRNVGTVGQSINELNNLLKLPHLRGKFGEAELGNLLADFLPAGAYSEQVQIVPESKEAVDATVNFPNAKLPIDSKFNREQILPLFETNDPQQLKEARKQLAVVIKQQAQSISDKYIHPEHGTTDLGLMFLPSETIYFEVIRDLELCEALHKVNVFPVSPNTLAITLKSVAMSFKFYEFNANVKKTVEQIRQAQRNFGLFQDRFDDVRKGLEKAQQAYDTAAGHLNRYSSRVATLTGEGAPELTENGAGSAAAEADNSTDLLLDLGPGSPGGRPAGNGPAGK